MTERFLLVQCCHPPHFLYLAEKIREKHPGCRLEALVLDHPQVRLCLERFPSFEGVFFYRPGAKPEAIDVPANVVFPLWNRGYRKIKMFARSLGGHLLESDFEANLRPLTKPRLLASHFRALHSPSQEFEVFLAGFPHRPLGRRILLLESGKPETVKRILPSWESLADDRKELTRIPGSMPPREAWRRLRNQSFDASVVLCTGERGFLGLKLIPFILRLSPVLVVNENSDHFFAGVRSLIAFSLKRLRYGKNLPRQTLLFIQTESPEKSGRAISIMKSPEVSRGGPLSVFCSEADRGYFEELPEVQTVFTYKPRALKESLPALLRLFRTRPDVIGAVFSDRRIFRLQKLLFFLLPARHRLVFNENFDCFYLRPGTVRHLFRRDPAGPAAWRLFSKFLLFLPRFFFLVIWITVMKLKRAYTLSLGK
jgi:hypothetical protein